MNDIPLYMTYKGDRNYIQGGDFYNRINEMSLSISGLRDAFLAKLIFRSFCRNDAALCLKQPADPEMIVGSGTIVSGENYSKNIWIIESKRTVNERYPFDEDIISRSAVCKAKQITLTKKTGYTPIEEAIALTKILSYKTYPDIPGKWVFGQLNLKQPFMSDYHTIHIEQKACVAGKFIFNTIYQNSMLIGDIRFIVGQP
jgi:hypothetical protein